MTIKQKLLLLIVFFIILPTLILPFIIASSYEEVLERGINASSRQNLSQIANSLEVVLSNMAASSTILTTDRELREILIKPASDMQWQEVNNISLVEGKIQQVLNSILLPYASSIVITGFNGNVYTSSNILRKLNFQELQHQQWYKDTLDARGSISWLAPAREYFPFVPAEDNNAIALTRVFIDDIEGYCGVLVIILDIQRKNWSLFDTRGGTSNTGFYITNSEGGIVYPSGPLADKDPYAGEINFAGFTGTSDSESITIKGQKLVVNTLAIRRTGWRIHQVLSYDEMTRQMKDVRSVVVLFQIILTVILLFAAVGISSNIANPMHRLALLMGEVPKGNFKVRMKVSEKGNSEIRKLGDSFNEMVKEMESLFNEVHKAYQLREKAQLEALQAQINPHFLLNTLNSIRWMATLSGAVNVSDMITALADLLDATLYRKDEMVELSYELQCLENYAKLQKIRYGDKFELYNEIPEELKNYKVPILILQPLVENSIIHGFHHRESGGIVRLNGIITDGYVSIEVSDNGNGMPEEVRENLLAEEEVKKKKYNRIGVKNVHDRIRLVYGREYGLRINSSENGTRIELILPSKWREDE